MQKPTTTTAAALIAADNIINPLGIATTLQSGSQPWSDYLMGRFSDGARTALSGLPGSPPRMLDRLLASELSDIAGSGQSLWQTGCWAGVPLRKRTSKLAKANPQGPELERFNVLLIEDALSKFLRRELCELADVVKKKGIQFRVYREVRQLKTKWNETYKIVFPGPDKQESTHAPSLEEAHEEIETLVERVLAGRAPLTKREAQEREEKAKAYDEIAAETAKIGQTEPKGVVSFVKDAVQAQFKLGDRPLLDFVIHEIAVAVKPVVRCYLQAVLKQYVPFRLARTDVKPKNNRSHIRDAEEFVAAMPAIVHSRLVSVLPQGSPVPPCPPDVCADDILPNDVQTWINSYYPVRMHRNRNRYDAANGLMAYARDALHALAPDRPTPVQLVRRPKPDTNVVPVPAVVLPYLDVWRILANLQDLETLFFFSLGVYAGLHETEIGRLVWEQDIWWDGNRATQIFVASGNGKDRNGKRLGQFVKVRYPLSKILGLGKGMTGPIVTHKWIFTTKLTHLNSRLGIEWVPSVMRHTFGSNLFGIGLTIEKVAREMRDTVVTVQRHYYAPIEEVVAKRLWSLPMGINHFKNLPFAKCAWDYQSALFQVREVAGKVKIMLDPKTALAEPIRKPYGKRQLVAWPDDLEMQVKIFEKSREQIARDLQCSQTAVSSHVRSHGLLVPDPYYFARKKWGLPVEVPEVVLKARAELAARRNGDTANTGQSLASNK